MSAAVPEQVKQFLVGLTLAVQSGKTSSITYHMETLFHRLSGDFYKQSEWPPVSAIEEIVDFDDNVIFLYQELITKHMHTALAKELTLENRFASWENYAQFFDSLIDRDRPSTLSLPIPTLWNLIDEFLYQYEEFAQTRARSYATNPSLFDSNVEKWSTLSVLKYLYKIIDVSSVKVVLKAEAALNTVTGDYYMAIKSIDAIDISQKRARHAKVTGANISLYYHLGFSYMMMRRYRDALVVFEDVLQTMSRMKQFHTRQYDQKKSDKIFALIAILLKYCPRRLDEQLRNALQTEHADKVQQVRIRDEEQLFNYASPKFVSPLPISGEEGVTSYLQQQSSVFLNDLKEQDTLPNLRAFLKLYSSVSLEKLAALLENDDLDYLSRQLLTLVHKNAQLQWKEGAASSGVVSPAVPINFSVEGDLVEVTVPQYSRQFAGHFLYQITKLNQLSKEMTKQ